MAPRGNGVLQSRISAGSALDCVGSGFPAETSPTSGSARPPVAVRPLTRGAPRRATGGGPAMTL